MSIPAKGGNGQKTTPAVSLYHRGFVFKELLETEFIMFNRKPYSIQYDFLLNNY